MLNLALTWDTYIIQDNWAHELELTDDLTEEEEDDMNLHDLFDETCSKSVA
jgi:hypothetical protein